jgi:tRNA modification GTPase
MTADATTACLLTPPGRGGIAVLALAGAGYRRILDHLFRPRPGQVRHHATPEPGQILLGQLLAGPDVIDEALVTLTPQAAEINIHGSSVSVRRTLDRLAELGAIVQSEPPESALPTVHPHWRNPAIGADLLEQLPRTRGQRASALLALQWSAGLSRLARETLDALQAESSDPTALAEPLRQAAQRLPVIRRLLQPPEVVLAGAPNAGKSTLANALVGRPVSLVHDRPGTTRDWVRELAFLEDWAVWLTDTAGLWDDPDHPLDAEAVRRSWDRIAGADLVVLAVASQPPRIPHGLEHPPLLRLATQADRIAPHADTELAVSAETGEGLDALRQTLLEKLRLEPLDLAAPAAFTPRQAGLLFQAADALRDRHTDPAADRLQKLLGA